MVYSTVLSGLYIFTLKARRTHLARPPSHVSRPSKRDELYLVVGEVHNPRKPGPAKTPYGSRFPSADCSPASPFSARWDRQNELLHVSVCRADSGLQSRRQREAHRRADPRSERRLLPQGEGHSRRVTRRAEDYIEISLDSEYRYNPLHNDLDAYALAYNIASLLNNLFGKGKEPFWQQAYTNLVKFIILLHKVAYDYVTLFDVYQCAISPRLLEERIREAEEIIHGTPLRGHHAEGLWRAHRGPAGLGFVHDQKEDRYLAPATPQLRETLQERGIPLRVPTVHDPAQADPEKLEQLEAVKRWFNDDWQRIEPKLRTSIVEGISVFLSLFDDNPKVKRVFCPPKECYDPQKNANDQFGKPLPSFSWLIENGKVCALNFPIGMNPGLAKALGVMMKLDFERAVLNRVPEIEAHPERYFRQVLFLCDEYQHFATVGENDPTGDEKFFSLSRQPKCIPIIATQSISSLKSALPGETWRTLLQTFRTKIFLALVG